MNWEIIQNNIKEAHEQLEEIEKEISSSEPPGEGELFVMLEHVYHHLNVAWNIRNIPTEKYSSMSAEEFNIWEKFPADFERFNASKNVIEGGEENS